MSTEQKQSSTWITALYYVISGLFIITVSIVGAWALEKNSIDKDLDRRVTALESKFERIDAKLDMMLEQLRSSRLAYKEKQPE